MFEERRDSLKFNIKVNKYEQTKVLEDKELS